LAVKRKVISTGVFCFCKRECAVFAWPVVLPRSIKQPENDLRSVFEGHVFDFASGPLLDAWTLSKAQSDLNTPSDAFLFVGFVITLTKAAIVSFNAMSIRFPFLSVCLSALQRNPLAQMEEERKDYECKMQGMKDEMEVVFEAKVKEKIKRLEDSKLEVSGGGTHLI
jgi:hypothetical protein